MWAASARKIFRGQLSGESLDSLHINHTDAFLPTVHTLVLKRPQDFGFSRRFPNLCHLVVESAALASSSAASLAQVVQRFCQPPHPSRITIYDSISSADLSLRHCVANEDILGEDDVAFLARRPGLKSLTAKPSLLRPAGLSPQHTQLAEAKYFHDLQKLTTRLWSFHAGDVMQLVPDVKVLVLDVIDDDHLECCVLSAITTTLRNLREIIVTYASYFLVTELKASALARFPHLSVLELRGGPEGERMRPLRVEWHKLQPLLAGLPLLERLWLPTPREWLPLHALSVIGRHCQMLRCVRFLTTWDMASLGSVSTHPVFRQLRTLILKSLDAQKLHKT
jgi:hypothetical protein